MDRNYYDLGAEFEYLSDPEGKLSLEDLLGQPAKHPFASSKDSKPAGVFTPIWLKLKLSFSEQAMAKQYFLFGRVGNLYDLRLYRPDKHGVYGEWVTGEDYPVSSRELDNMRYGFQIEPTAEPVTVYLRFVGGPGTDKLPWDLVEEHTYNRNSQLYYSLDVACLSGIGALLCFNLVIAFSLRRKDYFYYSAYVFSVMMGLITVDGIGFYYLWPDIPALNNRALHSFNLLSASLRLLTIVSFLGIAKMAPRMHFASLSVLTLLGLTFLAVNTLGVTQLPPYAATIPWAIGILFGFVVCVYAITLRIKLAWPLLITLLIPSASALMQGITQVNSLQLGILELQAAKIGFAVHVILFSLCLAAQIRIQAESHLEALHDSLTGLPGATLLQERFEWAANLSQRQTWEMSLLFIDLDGFKAVNDRMGHSAGDQVLVQAGARMQGVLRRTDFVARMGGDEFVVLLLDLPQENSIDLVADKLLTSLATPYRVDQKVIRISASIGVARYPYDGTDLPGLLKVADAAMYDAKNKGKNNYSFSSVNRAVKPGQFDPLTNSTNLSGMTPLSTPESSPTSPTPETITTGTVPELYEVSLPRT